MQRARFNTQIEGWLAQRHIFIHLDPLSRAMARAVCKDWRALMEARRLDIRNVFWNPWYQHAAESIEKYTWFPFRRFTFETVRETTKALLSLWNASPMATMLLRIGPSMIREFPDEDEDVSYVYDLVFNWFCIFYSGEPQGYDLILSPCLLSNVWRVKEIFWNAMGMGNTRLLDWLIERRWIVLDQKGGEYLSQRDKPEHFNPKAYVLSITHLKRQYDIPDFFWLELMDYFCTKKHLEEELLLPLIEQTGLFPSDWCDTIFNNKRLHAHLTVYEPFHNKIRHICGCAVKKQKK